MIGALIIRLICITLFVADHDYDDNILLIMQQIYFEVPFYSFLVVQIALNFSWNEFYITVIGLCKLDFPQLEGDTEDPGTRMT